MKRDVADAENLSMFDDLLNSTYFDVLEMPFQFDLDIGVLEKNYHQKQRAVHPDQFATKSASEKLYATEQSSFLNEAFLTLYSPLLRGKYFLKLKEKELGKAFESIPDHLFLMETLDQREKIENLIKNSDLQKEAEELEKNIKILEQELKNRFESNNYKEASDILMKLQYQVQALQNVQDRLI